MRFIEELEEFAEELEDAHDDEIEGLLVGTALDPILSELKKEVSPATG